MSYPGNYNFNAPQGQTFNETVTWKVSGVAVDLTSYTARMQVRPNVDSSEKYVDISSGSGITLGGAAGTVNLNVSASVMATVPAGKHVYDLELVSSGGVVTRLLSGFFRVTAEVTR